MRQTPEKFTPTVISNMTANLVKNADSLRSQLSKNAIQAIQESFQVLGKQMDPFIEQCTSVILRKAGDTNVFISEAARLAIEE